MTICWSVPDILPLAEFLAVGREFAIEVDSKEVGGGEAEEEGRHQQAVNSLLSELTGAPFLQTKECTEIQS